MMKNVLPLILCGSMAFAGFPAPKQTNSAKSSTLSKRLDSVRGKISDVRKNGFSNVSVADPCSGRDCGDGDCGDSRN